MRNTSIFNPLAALLLGFWLAATAAGQVQIYVATNGNDTTGNGTAGNPYATVGKGISVLNAAAAGSDLLIAPGNYTENALHNVRLSGSAANPVEIKGNGGQPYLMQQALLLQGVSHVKVDNLRIDGMAARAVCVYASAVADCTITNVVAFDTAFDATTRAEGLSLGMRDRLGGGETGNFCVFNGSRRVYFANCSVPQATNSIMFVVPDSSI